MLCDNPEGKTGGESSGGGEKEAQEGKDICILIADLGLSWWLSGEEPA